MTFYNRQEMDFILMLEILYAYRHENRVLRNLSLLAAEVVHRRFGRINSR